MDKSQLTTKMLEWETKKKELDALEVEIKNEILHMEESFDAGNVHASFSGGRRTFDYKSVGEKAPQQIIAECTSTIISTDWKTVCEKAQIMDIPFTMGNPSVNLKIK